MAGLPARLALERDGAWTRLAPGEVDPVTGRIYAGPAEGTRLRPGDLLIVDEAGMLDQDTARALLTVADEAGRGWRCWGTATSSPRSAAAASWTSPPTRSTRPRCLTLDSVHRFTRTDSTGQTVPDRRVRRADPGHAAGDDPGVVFDALLARGRIQLHPDPAALQEALAATAADTTAGAADVRWWWTPASRPPSSTPPSGSGWSPTAASTTSGS